MNSATKSGGFLVLLTAMAASAAAQDNRPVAFTHARIHTLVAPPIDNGTLLVRDGRIAAVGADVAIPAGATVIDCKGGALMPGLVSAFSRAGIEGQPQGPVPQAAPGGRRRGPVDVPTGPRGGVLNQAATKVAERLYPKQPIFGELLRQGITTLALVPSGNGLPGIGAVLRPDGKTTAQLVANDDAFVFVSMARDTQVKKILKESFDKAKKVLEERKKPKEPAKPEAKPEDKPKDEARPPVKPEPGKSSEPPKPEEKKETPPTPTPPAAAAPAAKPPEPPKDPNLEVLADLLDGKRRALLQIDSAADLLHWVNAVGEALEFPRTLIVSRFDQQAGTLDLVLEQAKKLKAAVLMPPQLTVRPRTRYLINPAKIMLDAGFEVGFVLPADRDGARSVFFQLIELVRNGLPAEAALKGVTSVPAKALGVDKDVGTLEVGKQANVLWFSGDPLDPSSELKAVWLEGRDVTRAKKEGADR